ncbi:MAG: peptidoglycan editing factor PgeF [Candidatus Tectomicrobia bacterium]|nr:peptidoglycan editing factor PgeF [Candidatus Tectomicrobia bacterium]
MIFDRIERDGVVFYQAAMDGFRCVFSTRIGGVSRGVCESLNLGWTKRDARENVARNRRLFSEAAGFENPKLLRQVHSARAIDVPAEETPEVQEGDALVTAAAGRALGVLTADCVPVALWDPVARCCAVAHAGRLGTARGVAVSALEKMAGRYGSRPGDVRAFIGPGIGPSRYEVGEDAMAEVRASLPRWREFAAHAGEGRFLLDLWGLNRSLLEEAGVPSDQVFTAGLCTLSDPREFFSYRRDGPGCGRMINVAWMEGG